VIFMAGKGPAPKGNAIRRNASVTALKVITAEPVAQPELPSFDVTITIDGKVYTREFEWPERTREWWRMWGASPLSEEFTETDWSELLDTALLHAKFWSGNMSVANELRLRVAKFGATPEDRARLRIQFARADTTEVAATQAKTGSAARKRRGPLTSA
jgi:hypothetical protein